MLATEFAMFMIVISSIICLMFGGFVLGVAAEIAENKEEESDEKSYYPVYQTFHFGYSNSENTALEFIEQVTKFLVETDENNIISFQVVEHTQTKGQIEVWYWEECNET